MLKVLRFSPDEVPWRAVADEMTKQYGSGKLTPVWHKATFTGHTDTVSAVAFSADGKTLATGSSDGTGAPVGFHTGNGGAAPRRGCQSRWDG